MTVTEKRLRILEGLVGTLFSCLQAESSLRIDYGCERDKVLDKILSKMPPSKSGIRKVRKAIIKS